MLEAEPMHVMARYQLTRGGLLGTVIAGMVARREDSKMQLLGFISLKETETADGYERWVHEVVHPAALKLPSISRYDVYRVSGPFRPGAVVPYQFTEVVTITSMEEVRRDFSRPEMVQLLSEFATRAEAVFLVADQIA